MLLLGYHHGIGKELAGRDPLGGSVQGPLRGAQLQGQVGQLRGVQRSISPADVVPVQEAAEVGVRQFLGQGIVLDRGDFISECFPVRPGDGRTKGQGQARERERTSLFRECRLAGQNDGSQREGAYQQRGAPQEHDTTSSRRNPTAASRLVSLGVSICVSVFETLPGLPLGRCRPQRRSQVSPWPLAIAMPDSALQVNVLDGK